MSLETRLGLLISAIGADIKTVLARTTIYEQPTAPVSAVVGSLWVDTDDTPASSAIPVVTSLPSSATDGQEVFYLADATNGVVWHLKYRNSASAYKWEFVGGPPLRHRIDTDETFSEQATVVYVNAATPGPQITLPLAGDYVYTMTASLYVASESGIGVGYVGLSLGGAGPQPPDVMQNPGWVSGQFGAALTHTRPGSLIAQPVSQLVQMKYYVPTGAAGIAHTRWRELQITPIRVG